MKRIIYLVAIIVPLLSFAQQTPIELSMEEAVGLAIQNSPLLNKAVYDQEIAKFQMKQAVGGYLPQVNINGQFSDNFSLPLQQLPGEVFGGAPGTTIGVKFGVRYGVTSGVEVSQILFDQQKLGAVKSAGALQSLMTLKELSTKEDLVYNVAQTYLQVQVTQQQEELVRANLDREKRLYEISKSQFENGILKGNDLKQLAVNQRNTETQLLEVQYNLVQLKNLLKLHLSLPLTNQITLTDDLIEASDIQLQEGLSLESNVQFRQLIQQEELSVINEKYMKGAYAPTLKAFLNYGYNGQTNEFKFSGENYNNFWNGTWGLTLRVPVFGGLQTRNKVQQAKVETLMIKEDKTYLEQTLAMNYDNAVNRMALSRQQASVQKENMQLAQDVYESISESYKEGVSALSELLDTGNSLQVAQANYLTNLLQMKLAELEHLKSSGQLAQLIENSPITN